MPHYLLFIVSGNIFTIVPVTQYVYLNDTVEFECATNLTEYHLILITKGECSKTQDKTPDAGGKMVSCSLTASSEINGTNVTCHTYNGDATEPAYVYVQGQLLSINVYFSI